MMPVCMILDKTLHQVCSLVIYIYMWVCVCIYIPYLDDTHTEISIYRNDYILAIHCNIDVRNRRLYMASHLHMYN